MGSEETTPEKKQPLWIKHYRLENIRAVQLEEMECGQVQVFKGSEGTGKTTRLEALGAAFQTGKHRPALVREGADEGTVIIELTDGTRIERSYTPEGGAPRARVQRGRERPTAVQQFLDELFGEHAFDPIAFMDLTGNEQTQELMQHMPVELARKKTLELGDGREWEGVDYGAHPLALLEQLEQVMCAERLEVGREEKMHQETAYGIFHDDLPEGFDAEAAEAASSEALSGALGEARAHNNEVLKAELHRRKARDEQPFIQSSIKSFQRELDLEIERRQQEIRTLQNELELETERRQHEIEQERSKIDELTKLEDDAVTWLAENEPIDTDDLLAQLADHDKTKERLGVWRSAQEHQEKATELKTTYLHLADLIQAVRLTPGMLLSEIDIPIENLTFNTAEGWFEINGRPLDALSDGERLRLALDVARMTTGPLKVICIDRGESLDPERWEQLLEAARADEFQYFISKVGEGELTIACFDGEEEEDGT